METPNGSPIGLKAMVGHCGITSQSELDFESIQLNEFPQLPSGLHPKQFPAKHVIISVALAIRLPGLVEDSCVMIARAERVFSAWAGSRVGR